MENTVFIHTNNKQMLGALLSKFSIERLLPPKSAIGVVIINVEEYPVFKKFIGKTFLRNGVEIRYTYDDLQSFTLSRFMPPELMHFKGKAVVIDPDIFACKDVSRIFSIDLKGNPVGCCKKGQSWDTSVMVLENSKLEHWHIESMLEELAKHTLDYSDLISLTKEKEVLELPRIWNSLDTIEENTFFLHTTRRITQPWKTGLPIDFTIHPMKKIFGIIPREVIHKMLGRFPSHYLPHPNKEIERFFLLLLQDAISAGAVTNKFLKKEVALKHVRTDIFEVLKKTTSSQ